MLWHEMSWPQLDQVDRDTPVVIPIASCEQHGHHLPVFVDSLQVQAVADRVEQELSDEILLTPNLWLGSSHHHLDFPGTISLPPSLYTQVIQSVAECVLTAGFRRIFFLNGHGGNQVPVSQALTEMVCEDDHANDAYLTYASWWHVGKDGMKPEDHGMSTPFISHACEYETSLMLAIRPDLVDMDNLARVSPVMESDWVHSEYGGKVLVAKRFANLTATGNMGKAEHASADKGNSLLYGVVGEVVKFLKEFKDWPDLDTLGPKSR